jgi:bifunctional DNA-binding transcriptional regulator/antitoxin component of YhaV-PrlF toxin-antitoxin module
MNTSTTTKIIEMDNGDLFIEIPYSILKNLGWQEGTKLEVNGNIDGSIEIKKPVEMTTIELDLSEKELLDTMIAAHKLDITFNQFVMQAIENAVNNEE